MIAPYIGLAVTGTLAAARCRGFLLWWVAFDTVATVALKLIWVTWHVYAPLWAVAEPVRAALGVGVALTLSRPRWPVYVAAIAVHAVALDVSPDRWPGTWLQVEEQAVALVALMCGLSMMGSCKKRLHVAVAALFLGTAAAYYCVPGNPEVRVWLMWWQCACYVAMLF